MNSLYIKNGKDINNQPLELLIENGKISRIAPQLENIEADSVINLQGLSYVSAGWIDDHVHCYEKLSLYYDDPDLVGYRNGVTTIIDAGSTGADNIGDFYKLTQDKKTNVYAMINISRTGILAQDELGDMDRLQFDLMQQAVNDYPDFIIGLKARISKSVVVDNGIKPLIVAKEFQNKLNPRLPLMVHVGTNPPELSEIMDLLEAGDIITHCFNGKTNGILTVDGDIKPFVQKGLTKGIIFDIGHGTESFNFKTATVATDQQIYPQSLSTDIYHGNRENGPVYNMVTCIEKMLVLGFDIKQVLPMITSVPAKNYHLDTKGTLVPGMDADVTIFNIENKSKTLEDSDGNTRQTNTVIEPIYSVVGGEAYLIGDKNGSL